MLKADIETLAQKACFMTDVQQKQQAQKQFMNFCGQLRPADYEGLMQNFSQTVIFVLMEYTYKGLEITGNVASISDVQGLLMVLQQVCLSWFSKSASFVRGGKPLQRYVQKSVGRTLGQALKIIYHNKDTKQWVMSLLRQQPSRRFRVYLWKVFIQAVSEIDTKMGFLNYRTLVYSFQEEVIPAAADQLIPYFLSVRSSVEVNLLSAEFNKSGLEDKQHLDNQKIMLFTPEEIPFSTLVFDVLKEIICFTYNITYSEYDLENAFENSSICFPDAVTQRIVAKEFIESVFFMIEKLVSEMPKSEFLIITLDCLQKILLCRMTYIEKDTRKDFLEIVLTGMNRILTNPSLTPKVLTKLLDANVKMLNNTELYRFRKYEPEFTKWLENIKNVCCSISASERLNYDNEVFKMSYELALKAISLSISPKLEDYRDTFRALGNHILRSFLESFFTKDFDIMGETSIRKVKQLKKVSGLFFHPIKMLIGVSFTQNLQLVEQVCNVVFASGSFLRISNLLLLIADMTDANYLQRNIFYENPSEEDVKHIGKILHACLNFINRYHEGNEKNDYIQIAIMIFVEKMISQSLRGVEWKDDKLQLTGTAYKVLREEMRITSDEAFLIQCFKLVIKGLECNTKERAQFALEVLSTQIMKFKWALRRQNFKSSNIARDMLRFCIDASKSSLKGNMLKLRKKLFEIITMTSFDDVMDSFKENIDGVIQQMAAKRQTAPEEIIFDMTGICSTIDTSNIYKYFLTRFEKAIGLKDLMKELFNKFAGDQKLLKAILKMQLTIVQNRSQRLSNQKNATKLYKIIQILMPYWNEVLMVCKTQDKENIIHQIHKIFRAIVRGGHVNFFLIEQMSPVEYNRYLPLYLQSIINVSPWIQQYPKFFQLLIDNGLLIMRDMTTVILSHNSQEVQEYFSQIVSYFMGLNIKLIRELMEGNRKSEAQLEKTFDVCRTFLISMKTGLKYIHRTTQVENINFVLKDRMAEKEQYLIEMFQFCLGNGRNHTSFMRTVYSIIQEMSILYNNSYDRVMMQLGVDQTKINTLSAIWKGQTNAENDLFIVNLKDWFKMCDADYILEIDY